eukprot:3304041-Pleurochrysis_carterae.AAC.1
MRTRAFWQECADLLIRERYGLADRAKLETKTRATQRVCQLCTDPLIWTWPAHSTSRPFVTLARWG